MSKKVLIVEDMKEFHNLWKKDLKNLGSDAIILSAFSIGEAKKLFNDNPDIDAIVMDACVPGNYPTTQPLVREFRKIFSGPIIAVSSIEEYREMLIEAGCNYGSEKSALSEILFEILK